MKTIMLCTILTTSFLGIAGMLRSTPQQKTELAADPVRATDGAFRDGWYQGKLTAERGLQPHVALGRWSREADRTSFAAGYLQAYAALRAR